MISGGVGHVGSGHSGQVHATGHSGVGQEAHSSVVGWHSSQQLSHASQGGRVGAVGGEQSAKAVYTKCRVHSELYHKGSLL